MLRLTLDDQPSRNSLSEKMLAEIAGALAAAADDPSIAVIIIASLGPVFSAGHNLKEITAHRGDADLGAAYFQELFTSCSTLMQKITCHRCPIIAEVNGLASAAGCQLVASCDLAYGSFAAKFCTPGVNIGLFCSTPMVALTRSVGTKHAMEMLLTGNVFDAKHGHRIGLLNGVVEPDVLTGHVTSIAQSIAAKSGAALCYGKKLFQQQLAMPLPEAYSLSSQIMAENVLVQDATEGISALIEKRQPKWN